jgi:hypothetical protein
MVRESLHTSASYALERWGFAGPVTTMTGEPVAIPPMQLQVVGGHAPSRAPDRALPLGGPVRTELPRAEAERSGSSRSDRPH